MKQKQFQRQKSYNNKFCPLCEAYSRPTDHYLSKCPYLPESEKRFINRPKYRLIEALDNSEEEDSEEDTDEVVICKATKAVNLRKVDVASSPYLTVQYGKNTFNMLLDSGAETSLIELDYAKHLKIPISATSTSASLADGSSPLRIVGEVHIMLTKGDLNFKFDALVAEKLTDKVIAGIPFLTNHDIYARPSKKTIYIGQREFRYGCKTPSASASIMRVARKTILLPGDSLQIQAPDIMIEHKEVAVEPKLGAPSLSGKFGRMWIQPQILPMTPDGFVELKNNTPDTVVVSRHEQLALIRPVTECVESFVSHQQDVVKDPIVPSSTNDYMDIDVDPHNLFKPQQRQMFTTLHKEMKSVFDSRTLGCYNGQSGPLEVVINMGPTQPPQRKGRMPLYSDYNKQEMQQICDSLEGTVLLKPEEVGITCEYINPSFLVKKSSGKKRLVTAFAEVGSYAKPQPALMPDINSVLQVGNWSYIVKTDLTSAYWQMPLSKNSMKYCGIATPYKGVRVYGRGAMGMPGTETALEELLCRILGEQLAEGYVTKVADDLMCGGSTPEEVFHQWKRILTSLQHNGLRLSAAKTVICPKSVSILGWTWQQGTLKASSHKVSALASVEAPSTVAKMKSYIGGVKYLSRVMKDYADVLYPLEEAIAGRNPSEKIAWTDHLTAVFKRSQNELRNVKTLTIPRKDDQLNIITDASSTGIGAALYVIREGKPYIAGYFNAKHKKHQESWLPCEWEALSISSAVTHFAPNIINSDHQTIVLTDSLPCVQAYKKLCRGQFSTSSRVVTFLSVLSRFNTHIMHIKGSNNTYSDYASRNAIECTERNCQVCTYIQNTADSVVRSCSVQDVLQSGVPVPFSSRSGWLELQISDRTLRRTAANLKQGTKPGRKETRIKDVKRYLLVAKLSKDGLLISPHYSSYGRTERIIVPRCYVYGLLECLHLKLEHPSKSQLRKVFSRAFYALDLEDALEVVTKRCHTCLALSDMPNKFLHQTTTTNPDTIGSNFSADVLRRSGQAIVVLREYISAYTCAKIIPNEQANTLRTSLIFLLKELIAPSGPLVVVKVDPASAFRSLLQDSQLKSSGIRLELGEPKFVNKNPVAEKSIRELRSEINRVTDSPAQLSEFTLAKAVSNLNSRIRSDGLSSREIWTGRNQYTNEQLPLNDRALMKSNKDRKLKGHLPSAKFKSRGNEQLDYSPIEKGSLIYINSDRDKTRRRDRYIVTSVEKDYCHVQKFAGNQLRARPYKVNRSDILLVRPWKFEDADSDEISDEEVFKKSLPNHTVNQVPHISDESEDESHGEENESQEENESGEEVYIAEERNGEVDQNILNRRRRVRPPALYDVNTGNEGEEEIENEMVQAETTTRSGRRTKPPARLGVSGTHFERN